MKTKLLTLLILFISLQTNAVNVTIIESLTGNSWAVQDSVWHFVANGMGYNASVVPQSTLDNISNLASTDILIVASGTISFAATNHLMTVRQFVQSGRPAYIQSEYLATYQGNITFDSLMHAVNSNFNWIQTVAGSLVPMNVLGTFSTTPNIVNTLNYFNYGYSGTGTGVEKFLEYNGDFFGFCYSDPNKIYGDVITISDEDWAWNNSSPGLMGNILYKLANSISTSVENIKTSKSSFNIFPNPAGDFINVRINENLIGSTYVISDLSGKIVLTGKLNSSDSYILLDDLTEGVYVIGVGGCEHRVFNIIKR